MLSRQGFATDAVALVSGAGSGIGAAVTRQLAAHGVAVAMVDRDPTALQRTRATLEEAADAVGAPRPRSCAITADVADAAAITDAFDRAAAELGPLRHVVAAAGVLRPAPLAQITAVDWQSQWQTNVTGALHLLQGAQRHLPRGGSVVVVSSNAAVVPRIGMAAYAASKAATSALTRSAGLELAAAGIRCNLVAPGTTRTPMLDALWADLGAAREQALAGEPERFRLGIPLGRVAEPDDIADNVVHLLSDRARHVTMQELVVDGGASL